MARTINILSDSNALVRFASSDGAPIGISSVDYDWEASNATLIITSDNYVVNNCYVLQMFPQSASDITLAIYDIPLNVLDNNRVLSANMKIKVSAPIYVSALLYIDSASAAYSAHSQLFTSGQYNAIHTNQALVPDDENAHTASIIITISGHSSNNVFMTLPHLIHDLAFYENPFIGRMRSYLPDFYFDIDSQQAQPSFPYFRLADILTSAAGETTIEHDRLYGVEQKQVATPDETSEYWAKSSLVSPRSVRTSYIPWLAQFTGSQIKQNIQAEDGTLLFDNDGIRRDFIEWQLQYSYYGRAAGSREAMTEAARQVLLKTKDGEPSSFSVAITPKYLDDPFLIKVQTLTNETPDADTGEESYLVLQSVNWAKPMGYMVIHETVDEFYFSFDDPSLGVLDSLRFG